MKGKILFLVGDKKQYYFPNIVMDNIMIENVFLCNSKIRKLFVKCFPILTKLFYGKRYTIDRSYDKIIIFDSAMQNEEMLKSIEKKFPKTKKIIYFWNIMQNNKFTDIALKHKANFDIYSYDERDCLIYGVNFNSIMYFCQNDYENNENDKDVCYVGIAKDRLPKILSVYSKLIESHFSADFKILCSKKQKDYYKGTEFEKLLFNVKKMYIPYRDYLRMVSKSTSILDIVQEKQAGLSMRVMEMLYCKKKLITNNSNILNTNLFNKNNIFVIYDDFDEQQLLDFLKSPFECYDDEIIEYYKFSTWLERFD